MGVTKLTALTIQGWPDTASIDGEGIYVTAGKSKGETGWSGHVYLVKESEVHRLLLSTQHVFESKEKAVADMKRTVESIRNLILGVSDAP